MKRIDFLKTTAMASTSLPFMQLNALGKLNKELKTTHKMPMMFVGHGTPLNAILDNNFSRKWKELGNQLETPQAILVISAHWITNKVTKVTAMKSPKTIHDFGGFPDELFQQQYPAPGAPEMSKITADILQHKTAVVEDFEWGLDHGTWAILKPMFPKADVPVYQLSVDYSQPATFHYELGKELNKLRKKGVLIIGSGNIVHNLSKLRNGIPAYDWTKEFDSIIAKYIDDRNFNGVVNFQKLGHLAKIAHPTYDHFLPLLYTLGAMDKKDEITYFNDSFDLGAISMRSLLFQ